jgi:hypothetical protein
LLLETIVFRGLFVYFSVSGQIVMQSCNSFIDDMQYA